MNYFFVELTLIINSCNSWFKAMGCILTQLLILEIKKESRSYRNGSL